MVPLRWLLVSLGLCATHAFAAADLPTIIPPQADVIAFARANRIPLEGIAPAAATKEAIPGDFVVVLITLREGKAAKQWLTRFEVARPTEKERKETVETTLTFPVTTSETRQYEFKTTASLALDILAAGPFVVGEKPPAAAKRARALISPEFLALGLDEACRLVLRQKDVPEGTPVKWTTEEERTIAGMVPALVAFIQGIQGTPGLKEILWEIIEKPSVWSMIKSRGQIGLGMSVGNETTAIEPAAWAFSDRRLYGLDFSLSLNQQPALRTLLVVTAPRPPLVTTAGIVGILARPPGQADKRMDLQLIAAGRATDPVKP